MTVNELIEKLKELNEGERTVLISVDDVTTEVEEITLRDAWGKIAVVLT
jgi:hypothetical protein